MSLISAKKSIYSIQSLSCNKNTILQKADKGNSVALVNNADYIKKIKKLFRLY